MQVHASFHILKILYMNILIVENLTACYIFNTIITYKVPLR